MQTFQAIRAIDFSLHSHFIVVPEQTLTLVHKSRSKFTISNFAVKLASGTCTVAIKINGTNVTGLSSVSVTTTASDTSATAANTVNVGDKVEMTISSVSGAANMEWTLGAIG